jgi:NADH-quinone oxidoreductase subunit L
MMAAAGAGATDAGFFHLLTHGVFKALLFLGAGAVIHAVGTNDIFRMGGLWRPMPQTGLVFIVGTLALAGVWPLAGFFSKEEVLAGVWAGGRPGVFVVLAVTAFLTAFYMFRVVFITFFGHGHPPGEAHPHDPPWLMRGPLWVLAILTVAIGLHFTIGGVGEHHPPPWLTVLSLALAGSGIGLAWAMYKAGWLPVEVVQRPLAPIEFLARRRYFLDAIYGGIYRAALLGFARLVGWVDRYLVDGVLNVASACSLRAGDTLRRLQTGQAQDYVYGVAFGVLLLFAWAQWWRTP